MNNTVALKDAVQAIRDGYGEILKLTKIYFEDYAYPDTSLAPVQYAIDEADIILVDIRADVRIKRELPAMLRETNNTVIVLIGASAEIFALTRMGKFRGERIFKPDKTRQKEFDINAFVRAKKFSALTKKLGRILPLGMLKDMRNWVLAQEYYTEGDAENLKNLLLFIVKKYAGIQAIKKIPPPKHQPDYGLYRPGTGETFYQDIEDYHQAMNHDPAKPTIGLVWRRPGTHV